ncbi:MAG: transporter substrate-binding domain-containing protein [Microscillaceae bacterium]|jgi:ABC-type amino acid transport substrate-binding protein/serine phosphatase RsbU (regulator of sigma subunit)|nr:transporter substrate-binding domain-containing protein [Microscillaceae bacterium]
MPSAYFKSRFLLFILLFGVFSKLNAQTKQTVEYRVGLYENKPLAFRDTDGGFKGIYIDILEHIALQQDWQLQYVYEESLEKCLENLEKGKIDILVALGYSDERAKKYDFTQETVITNWGEIYVHKDSTMRSILNLENKKVAVVKGNVYYEGSHGLKHTAQQFKIPIQYQEVQSFKEALERIDKNQADAALISVLYGEMHQKEYQVQGTPIVFHPNELRFALTKDRAHNPQLIKALDDEMKEMLEDENSVFYQSEARWLNRTASTVNYAWLLWGLAIVGGVAALFVILSFVLRRQVQRKTAELVKKNREIQELNEGLEIKVQERTAEVMQQKAEIEVQKRELEIINKQMRDSITYARNIQEAILPEEDKIAKYLPDYFILSLPRDIVSGDFHWFAHNERNHFNLLAVADCTGHGVPGAFMSMLGKSSLDYIMHEKQMDTPGQILQELQADVYRALGTNAKDGMDIALCGFDFAQKKAYFAGAQSALYLVRAGEVYVIKGEKFPIGGSVKYYNEVRNFHTHTIELMSGDTLYMTSDGFPDQFGGADNMKYTSRRFRDLLKKIADQPMTTQRQALHDEHRMWRGQGKQIDDILVVGVKFA